MCHFDCAHFADMISTHKCCRRRCSPKISVGLHYSCSSCLHYCLLLQAVGLEKEMEQSPCPHRIIDDFGSAYLLGAVGSGAFHMIKGVRNSPKGFKFQGGIQNTALRAPTTGGAFALWGGMFATYDCSLAYIRRKEDSWNAMIAGGLTNSTLALRGMY